MGNSGSAPETPNKQSIHTKRFNELQPITFEEFGQHSDSIKLKEKDNIASQLSTAIKQPLEGKFKEQTSLRSSSKKDTDEINFRRANAIIEEHEWLGKGGVEVPFQVVELTFDTQFLATLQKCNPQLFQNYRKQDQLSRKWILNSKGYYLNHINPTTLAIIKPGHLYQGEYLQQGEKILPNGEGVLITTAGMFVGKFATGQPQGKGCYYDTNLNTLYQGTWNRGKLQKGSISRDDFQFKGSFSGWLAEGKGMIKFTENQSIYKGLFRNGQYDDPQGFFESSLYIYSGGFREGKKEGQGCLIEKQRNLKSKTKNRNKNKIYHPEVQHQGFFKEDSFLGRKLISN